MIHNVLPIIANELNDFLKLKYSTSEDKVIVSNLVTQDGSVGAECENKIVSFLLNIEQERSIKNANIQRLIAANQEVSINLYVIYAAYFTGKNYPEALKFISSVIEFFQGKSHFTHQNTPMLSNNADRLTVQMVNMDLQQLSNLWGNIGAKYLPSVIYKVRMLTYNENMIKEEVPRVLGLTQDTKG
jgi:hypothetical protein